MIAIPYCLGKLSVFLTYSAAEEETMAYQEIFARSVAWSTALSDVEISILYAAKPLKAAGHWKIECLMGVVSTAPHELT